MSRPHGAPGMDFDPASPKPERAENRTGLPDSLKAGLEKLSGFDLSGARVHYNSGKPAQVQALAYTRGQDIHVGPGQEKHLPHEGWHLVQQAQGRVKPTMQAKGVPINDDAGLEREAEVMGAESLSVGPFIARSDLTAVAEPGGENHAAQLKKEYKVITGITHLVEMTDEGSIYSEDYEGSEYAEVSSGDFVEIETDDAYYSRRGPNQEDYNAVDRTGPKHYLWFRVLKLNGRAVDGEVYVREGTFESASVIDIPRDRREVDRQVELVQALIEEVSEDKDPSKLSALVALKSVLQSGVKNALVSRSADSRVDLNAIGVAIRETFRRVEEALEAGGISRLEAGLLDEALRNLALAFQDYHRPKRQLGKSGKLNRAALQQLGVTGIDVGGIGLHPGLLDVNIEDVTNNPNFFLEGDAMDLPSAFEPGSTDSVTADLLPLVLMVAEDSNVARRNAVERVLAGVNHVTNDGGNASIDFNDNSGLEAITGRQLLEIAQRYGFDLYSRSHSPVARFRRFTFIRGAVPLGGEETFIPVTAAMLSASRGMGGMGGLLASIRGDNPGD